MAPFFTLVALVRTIFFIEVQQIMHSDLIHSVNDCKQEKSHLFRKYTSTSQTHWCNQ